MWIRLTVLANVLANALALFGLSASSSFAAEIEGSAQAGATKAAVCLACHGMNGNSTNPEWPTLAGQNPKYIKEQLQLFKKGERVNPLMSPMATALTDQDIADLAAYYSQQTPAGLEADPSYWKAGEKLYRSGDHGKNIPACIACHGPAGRGNDPAMYPALRAQQAIYTQKQLNDFAAGTRPAGKEVTPQAQMMQTIARRMSAEDIRNVASYLQGMR